MSNIEIIENLSQIKNYSAELFFLDISGTLLQEDLYRDLLESREYYKHFLKIIEEQQGQEQMDKILLPKELLSLSKHINKKTTQPDVSQIIQDCQKNSVPCALTSGYPSITKKRHVFTYIAKIPIFFTITKNKGSIIVNILQTLQDKFNIIVNSIAVVDNHYSKLIEIQKAIEKSNYNNCVDVNLLLYKQEFQPIYLKNFQDYWRSAYITIANDLLYYRNIKHLQNHYHKYYIKTIWHNNIERLAINLYNKRKNK